MTNGLNSDQRILAKRLLFRMNKNNDGRTMYHHGLSHQLGFHEADLVIKSCIIVNDARVRLNICCLVLSSYSIPFTRTKPSEVDVTMNSPM